MRGLLSGAAAMALALGAGMASAQDFSADRLSQDIRHISSDDFMGRYPGTEGERMTLAWLQAQYEAMGLEPGGRDGQWLQPVVLSRYTPVEGAASAAWTGPDGQVRPLTIGTDIIVRAATNDGRADLRDVAVVFAGYGIHAPERDWDDYGDIDVTGKVVIVLPGEPTAADVTERFNGAYPTTYNSAAYKADEAFRRGAVGVITLITSAEAWPGTVRANSRERTLTPGGANLEFSGGLHYEAGHAMALAAGLGESTLAETATGRFKAVALDGVTLSVATEETIRTLTTYNLLARIPGTTHPDEVIVYSAHWDHVGVGADHVGPVSETEDNIYNGAWDNASGTVGIVEMARQLAAAPRPQRSIVFAHMAAEEMGLLGAYAYTADPVYSLGKTVADINIDMLPLSPPTRDVAIFGQGQNDLEDRLAVLAEAEGRYVGGDGMPEQGFYYRSDHFPFARAGVPALMTWHGWDWDEGGREVGEAAWKARFAADYHRPSDEWSADLDLRSAVENLTLLYRLGLELANSGDWPGWKPMSEFGVVRERTAAQRQ